MRAPSWLDAELRRQRRIDANLRLAASVRNGREEQEAGRRLIEAETLAEARQAQQAHDRQRAWEERTLADARAARLRTSSLSGSSNPVGQPLTVRGGLAVPYDEETFINLSGGIGYIERFAPGSLEDFMATKPDVMLLMHHDRHLLMARTSNDTLRLRLDRTGLRWDADAADTSYSRDAEALRRAGTLRGVSFAFNDDSNAEVWDEKHVRTASGATVVVPRLTIHRVTLLDEISPVSRPAYKTSHLGH